MTMHLDRQTNHTLRQLLRQKHDPHSVALRGLRAFSVLKITKPRTSEGRGRRGRHSIARPITRCVNCSAKSIIKTPWPFVALREFSVFKKSPNREQASAPDAPVPTTSNLARVRTSGLPTR